MDGPPTAVERHAVRDCAEPGGVGGVVALIVLDLVEPAGVSASEVKAVELGLPAGVGVAHPAQPSEEPPRKQRGEKGKQERLFGKGKRGEASTNQRATRTPRTRRAGRAARTGEQGCCAVGANRTQAISLFGGVN